MKINFVTNNSMKFDIAKAYFAKLSGEYELAQYAIETPEMQDISVEEIARESAVWAAKATGLPCIKLDVGCFIEELNGFPGPFVKYVNDWLSQADILKLMEHKVSRRAYFEDALAIGYPDGTSQVFSKRNYGVVAETEDQENTRWTMNSLFMPDGHDRTLGRMTDEEQVAYWGDGNWPALITYLEC